jgi:hypothetical protein
VLSPLRWPWLLARRRKPRRPLKLLLLLLPKLPLPHLLPKLPLLLPKLLLLPTLPLLLLRPLPSKRIYFGHRLASCQVIEGPGEVCNLTGPFLFTE